MKIMIITDAWDPQVNGVVRTLKQTCAELIAMGHELEMITPNGFKSIPFSINLNFSFHIIYKLVL